MDDGYVTPEDQPQRRKRWGRRTNAAFGKMTHRIDDQTGDASHKAAQMATVAVRLLRIPTLLLVVIPVPFIVITAIVGITADGWFRIVALVIAAAMAIVWGLFTWTRRQIIRAVEEPDVLATEFGIMVSLSDRADETRGVLEQLAGGGGARLFSRLKGAWRGATMPARWIDQVGDLPRARYFAPPRIGFAVTLTIAALWLVPISVVVALFLGIGALAGSIG